MGVYFYNLRFALVVALVLFGCSKKDSGNEGGTSDDVVYSSTDIVDDSGAGSGDTRDVEEDSYSIYTDPCVNCAMYFCPPLDAVWQKQICINNCDDPPTVV